MKLIHELLVYPEKPEEGQVYLATINTTVRTDGQLVMGGGNALAFAKAYPEAPRIMGSYFNELRQKGESIPPVMLFQHEDDDIGGSIGGLVTKTDPSLPSPIGLVQDSVLTLQKYAEGLPDETFHLPMPAVGLGGLTFEQVEPFVSALPDNVLVYYVPPKVH